MIQRVNALGLVGDLLVLAFPFPTLKSYQDIEELARQL